jgi:hypothetical protein
VYVYTYIYIYIYLLLSITQLSLSCCLTLSHTPHIPSPFSTLAPLKAGIGPLGSLLLVRSCVCVCGVCECVTDRLRLPIVCSCVCVCVCVVCCVVCGVYRTAWHATPGYKFKN